jgi:hypothetical protein
MQAHASLIQVKTPKTQFVFGVFYESRTSGSFSLFRVGAPQFLCEAFCFVALFQLQLEQE